MKVFSALLMLLINYATHAQVQKIPFGNIPADVLAELPGLQLEGYLIDAPEQNGDVGYLVLELNRRAFEQFALQKAVEAAEDLLLKVKARKSECRWGIRRLVNFHTTSSSQLLPNGSFTACWFDFNYKLLGQEETWRWQWRGFNSGFRWVAEPVTTMVALQVRANFYFTLEDQHLVYHSDLNGQGQVPYKGCWIFVNPLYNGGTPSVRSFRNTQSKKLNSDDSNAILLSSYLAITREVGIKVTDESIFIYLSLNASI